MVVLRHAGLLHPMLLCVTGTPPTPRFQHTAAILGNEGHGGITVFGGFGFNNSAMPPNVQQLQPWFGSIFTHLSPLCDSTRFLMYSNLELVVFIFWECLMLLSDVDHSRLLQASTGFAYFADTHLLSVQ